MACLHVSLVSPRIVNKIRENPRYTPESFPVYPPLPPPFQEGAQFAWVFSSLSKERAGGEAFPSEGLGGGSNS